MRSVFTRRRFLAASVASAALGALPADAAASAEAALTRLEARHGGRLGVSVWDTGSQRRIGYRAAERFPLMSTHKVLTVAAILAQVDQGRLSLEQHVPFGPADMAEYAPVTRKHVAAGFMTIDGLCDATISWSDNTADNLLLKLIGGPAGWTRYARSIGDTTSRLDRFEPELNSAIPGDPRDTTTPETMPRDLDVVLLGTTALSAASRARLKRWMFDNTITRDLIGAGLPQGWRIGDKSGAGERGGRNDIGLILPPGRAPLLASVYYIGSREPLKARNHVIAGVGGIIAAAFG